MNAEQLFESMNGIDDDILERSITPRKNPMRFVRPGLIAACCTLVLSLMYAHLRLSTHYPPPPLVEPTTTQGTTEDTQPEETEPVDVHTAQSSYVGGELIMQSMALSYVPEDGSNYLQIQFSEEHLMLSVQLQEREAFVHVRIETMSREKLVQDINGSHYVSYGEEVGMVDGDSVVPQCAEVTVYSYLENAEDEHAAYSVYLFDGVPKWFAESDGLRIYSLIPMPEVRRMTLSDVRALAQMEEQVTLDHLAWFIVTRWGQEITRVEFPIDAAYKLRFYYDGELSGNGELVCLATDEWVDIRTGDLDAFLEETRDAVEEWMTHWEKDYLIYLPPEESEMYSQTVTTADILHGWEKTLDTKCLQDDKVVLYWSVNGFSRGKGFVPVIPVEKLTLDILESYATDQGDISVKVLFDDVWIYVDSYGVPAQWLYEQLIAVQERVMQAG